MIPWVQIAGRVGAYAQAAAVEPGWLAPRPPRRSTPVTAATIPLNALTARQALELIAQPAGSTLLITGASGAVGGFATQLAVRDGLRVLAVASDGDEEWVAGLGAETGAAAQRPTSRPSDRSTRCSTRSRSAPRRRRAVRDGGVAVFTRRVGEIDGPQRRAGRDAARAQPIQTRSPS